MRRAMASPVKRRRAAAPPPMPLVTAADVGSLQSLPADSLVAEVSGCVVWAPAAPKVIETISQAGSTQRVSVFAFTLADSEALVCVQLWREQATTLGARVGRLWSGQGVLISADLGSRV